MSLHDGHRERIKQVLDENNLDFLEDHVILELLLYYAIPRVDTNAIAHELINNFGSLYAVFDAPTEELMKVKGVGLNAARLIKLIPQVNRRRLISKLKTETIIQSSKEAGEYLLPFFQTEKAEAVYMMCLDAKCKLLSCKKLSEGSVNATSVSIFQIVENAVTHKATNVIIAHNHTSGIAVPSDTDIATTFKIANTLSAMGIVLVDHIIVADDDFVSLEESGYFKKAERIITGGKL